jgi:hypothetical protein
MSKPVRLTQAYPKGKYSTLYDRGRHAQPPFEWPLGRVFWCLRPCETARQECGKSAYHARPIAGKRALAVANDGYERRRRQT